MNKGIIYKYRNWKDDNHKNVLNKCEIYLASPKLFNDPFDCRIPENLYLLDTEEKREKFANHNIQKLKDTLINSGYDLNTIKSNLKNRLKCNLHEEHLFNEKQGNDNIDKYYGVFSASKTWKSILMWSHYSDNHKGYCIGFKENLLINSGKFGRGGDVFYSNSFPTINPLDFEGNTSDDSFIQMHTKAKDWKYEEEYRLSILDPEGLTDSERLIKLDNQYISEVILGLAIESEAKNEIISICKDKGIKIYQAFKIPFRFEIKREEIK